MKKFRLFVLVLVVSFMSFPALAGERTIPVDIFLMIDKSLSMAEPGKIDSLQKWVQEHLIGQILINDDWITIYQFYGKTDHLLSTTVKTAEDRKKIITTIGSINADGPYTDIGLALDTLKNALKQRGSTGRLKIMFLLTDLKQEAPWTSRYAGSPDKFESPYLAEARMVAHDNWYEITLDMDIQESVVRTSQELYASILEQDKNGTPRILPSSEEGLPAEVEPMGTSGLRQKTDAGKTSGTGGSGKTGGGSLPLLPLLVLLSVIAVVCMVLVPVLLRNRRKKKEQSV